LSFDSLKPRQRCGARPWSYQIVTTEDAAMPTALAIARTVQLRRLVIGRLQRQHGNLVDQSRQHLLSHVGDAVQLRMGSGVQARAGLGKEERPRAGDIVADQFERGQWGWCILARDSWR